MHLEKHEFFFIETIRPMADETGQPLEFTPQSRYRNTRDLPLNPYGQGAFCRFKLKNPISKGGVYILASGTKPLYAGICENLEKRFSLSQYGSISPKNCYRGGQSTNCRINGKILQYAKKRVFFDLWFLSVEDKSERKSIENKLISSMPDMWNIQKA